MAVKFTGYSRIVFNMDRAVYDLFSAKSSEVDLKCLENLQTTLPDNSRKSLVVFHQSRTVVPVSTVENELQ